tara:strand:- start:50091 stop:50618 length:528 start_codon:yes stop_codon:yes gene_type:complete
MFTQVKKIALAASVSMIALSGAAIADTDIKISNVNVEASMSAATDSNAMEFYPEIATDIQTAVASMVPLSDDGADPEIRIDIRKISMDGTTMLPDHKKFNELEGVVNITNPTGANAGLSFPINIAAYSGEKIVPEGYIAVLPSDEDFYAAMVAAFASSVVEGLSNVNTAGDAISK